MGIKIVPSGSYLLHKGKCDQLEAFLGSCVGITMIDRSSGIGGLLHLLLAEPNCSAPPWRAEIYASTGLPLFIDAMCRMGARKADLVACVAGGALVGPVSKIDLSLDIGGRTAEIVGNILQSEQIPVLKSETGGYFSCSMKLDLSTMETTIEPIGALFASSAGAFDKPDLGDLQYAIEHTRPIPQIALKVIRMLGARVADFEGVADEIRKDQVLTAKVLRLCNSALVSPRKTVDSVGRAMMILGDTRVLELLISAALEDFLSGQEGGYSLCKGGLFKHALHTAAISKEISILSGKVSADHAYTAGLLHDIGKVVLDQFMTSAFPLFYRRVNSEGNPIHDLECELLGISHTDSGGVLAERWSLPDSLSEAIKYHHNPEKAELFPELVHIVHIADVIASHFLVGLELERIDTRTIASSLNVTGFSTDDFPSLVDSVFRATLQDPLLNLQ